MTTLHQRLIAIGVASAMLLSGFALGRVFDSPTPAAAEASKAALVQPTATQSAQAAVAENEAFYLKDFKTGYDDGYQLGLTKQSPNLAATERAGYNEGFKEGYSDAYQLEQRPVTQAVPVVYRNRPQPVYRTTYAPARRRGPSKTKTALTIAAPAAIGAGIGVAAGGKKGAAIGVLLGGGGGALYHLFKNKDR